uniref:General substrate transporter n=1 Tax=mine drainage metagenome TaxID=410659 RepID=E6PYZ6_9ZZZZ
MPPTASNRVLYSRFLLLIAGLGGLLYGIDVGIIAAALLYLSKTIDLTVQQTSAIVAAVLGGGMISSLVAGFLADLFGRKRMMLFSGLMFVLSVGIIVLSQSFVALLLGRLLQGMSGGIIAVVVPLYLAECLSARHRGRGTAIFQFMLTFGIVAAALTGLFYTQQAEAAIAAAAGNAQLIRAAQNHAWRGMFLSVIYPGILFFLGSILLSETPRWLVRKGRIEAARAALLRSVAPEEAETELNEMQTLAAQNRNEKASGSLLKRKYVVPFLLACAVLSLNQTTGINSVLGYLVIILKQAGMTASHAAQGDVAVKVLNCVMTIVAIVLVDRKGRKFLLALGTAGIVIALVTGGLVFRGFESERRNVAAQVQAAVRGNALQFPVTDNMFVSSPSGPDRRPMSLAVLYTTGSGEKIATALSNDPVPVLSIPHDSSARGPLVIRRAQYGPVPSEATGWMVTVLLGLFIASYAAGPGVVVWLMLSELMPTRIRAMGMGIALLLNQGISTLIADLFLPVVGNYGYFAMFFFWAACTCLYLLIAVFLIPETKGRSLEEIEMHFAR